MRCIHLLSLIALSFMGGGANAQAYADYAVGTVVYVSSGPAGIMFKIAGYAGPAGAIVPANCVGAPEPMFLISQAHPAMISLFLSRVMSGKLDVTVYTGASTGTYCGVSQLAIGAP